MDDRRTGFVIASVVGILVAVLWSQGALQLFEDRTVDLRFLLRGPTRPSSDVAVVAIDEESIARLGRFPWSRRVHAELTARLTELGARAVAFDVLFTEPDLRDPGGDLFFGKALRSSKRVVLSSFFRGFRSADFEFFDPVKPIAPLAEGAATVGFTNLVFSGSTDSVVRQVPLTARSGRVTVPSLAWAAVSLFRGGESGPRTSSLPAAASPLFLNFSGDESSFSTYSYHKVLRGEVPEGALRGKVVLVGATAAMLFDLKSTPFSAASPGVFVHAETISNLLLGSQLRPWPGWATLLLILSFSLTCGAGLARLRPLPAGGVSAVLLVAYLIAAQALFARNIYAEVAAPVLALGASHAGVLFLRLVVVDREKRWIKKAFASYLSPRVMEQVISNPDSLALGGHRRYLTVLFSDIRNFTTLSESMTSREVVSLLNEYLSRMVKVVFAHDGTLDKFIGDAVMAFWGAPVAQEDHERRAVLCALDMLRELGELQEKWRREGRTSFEIGIGINSGEVTVGNMGSHEKMEYTVIGDNVNLASRLEGMNKEYKTRILISEATYRGASDVVEAVSVGPVKVKGRTQPVMTYSVVGPKTSVAGKAGSEAA